LEDETAVSETNPDALRFKAKIDCMFCGLVWTRSYEGVDFKLKVQYRLATGEHSEDYEPASETIEISSGDSVIDARKDMHTWDF